MWRVIGRLGIHHRALVRAVAIVFRPLGIQLLAHFIAGVRIVIGIEVAVCRPPTDVIHRGSHRRFDARIHSRRVDGKTSKATDAEYADALRVYIVTGGQIVYRRTEIFRVDVRRCLTTGLPAAFSGKRGVESNGQETVLCQCLRIQSRCLLFHCPERSTDRDGWELACRVLGFIQVGSIHRIEEGPVPEADALLFHPDFLFRTPLAQKMKQYSFFSYASNEALHLSADERVIVQDYMNKIAHELEHPIDRFSKPLIISNIEVLLNYCMRFYERQFVTREVLNNDVLIRFEQLLDEYWDSGQLLDEYWDSGAARLQGLPTVKYFAEKVCLSPNYFGDLVKSETGKSPHELIQFKIAEIAKSALLDPKMNTKQVADMLGFQYPQHFLRFSLLDPKMNTKQVADMLGFQYPQHFLRFFKKKVGCTPKEYRTQNNLTVCS